MHSDIAELLQRIAYVGLHSYAFRVPTVSRYTAMVAAGAKPCRTTYIMASLCVLSWLWETIKAAAVLMAAVVASEYKTNDHFVRRGSQTHNGGANSYHRK